MSHAHRPAAGLPAGALLVAGCTQSVGPIERLGRKAVRSVAPARAEEGPHAGPRARPKGQSRPRAGAYTRWGLPAPLRPAPAPPARKPERPFVVDRVPTRDKAVFLSVDDGAERDPAFVRMGDDLKLPISMFLTDSVASPGYDQFDRLRRAGGGLSAVQNHTVGHAYLPGLPYAGQRAEICGRQDRPEARFAPGTALPAAVRGVQQPDTAGGGGLRGRDETTARILRRIHEQGFAVARIEDYL
ncbi:polysaccharide deacetylase family protein [Streptomyces sp. ISL-98]|uniref:polysaccharide deacetylase family protein n=1 Tax=Streptomyces sp. ISL-98 TaxID=2819192 RepID=UPI0027E52F55|nr:polysaccharide deacetylase family protein [Streptomyces sp. ISL-98]